MLFYCLHLRDLPGWSLRLPAKSFYLCSHTSLANDRDTMMEDFLTGKGLPTWKFALILWWTCIYKNAIEDKIKTRT
jgi:hypothetical protein